MARARRRDRAGPSCRRTGAVDHAVPDGLWRHRRRRAARPPAGRRGAGRLADRRRRRPQRRGAVANVAAVVGVDPSASPAMSAWSACTTPRAGRGSSPAGRAVPWCAAPAATRRSGSATTAGWCVPAAAPIDRRCARCVAGPVSPTCVPGVTRLREELEAAAGRPVVAVTGADAVLPTGRGLRRHGGGAPPRRPCRRRRLPRLRPRAAGSPLPGGRAGDGAAHEGCPPARPASSAAAG